jgi:hypothetical protein
MAAAAAMFPYGLRSVPPNFLENQPPHHAECNGEIGDQTSGEIEVDENLFGLGIQHRFLNRVRVLPPYRERESISGPDGSPPALAEKKESRMVGEGEEVRGDGGAVAGRHLRSSGQASVRAFGVGVATARCCKKGRDLAAGLVTGRTGGRLQRTVNHPPPTPATQKKPSVFDQLKSNRRLNNSPTGLTTANLTSSCYSTRIYPPCTTLGFASTPHSPRA